MGKVILLVFAAIMAVLVLISFAFAAVLFAVLTIDMVRDCLKEWRK